MPDCVRMFVQSAVLLTLTGDWHCTRPRMEYDTAGKERGTMRQHVRAGWTAKQGSKGRQPINRHGVEIWNSAVLSVGLFELPRVEKQTKEAFAWSICGRNELKNQPPVQSGLPSSRLSVHMSVCSSEKHPSVCPSHIFLLHVHTLACMSCSCAHPSVVIAVLTDVVLGLAFRLLVLHGMSGATQVRSHGHTTAKREV